jgi:hypothetical protein
VIVCPHCGAENPDDAGVCNECGQPLNTAGNPPRLLSQIQGLIPAEPVITSGVLRSAAEDLSEDVLPLVLPLPSAGESASEMPAAVAAGAAGIASSQEPAPEETGQPPLVPPPASPAKNNRALPVIAGVFFALILLGSLWNVLIPAGATLRPSVKNAYTFIEILQPTDRVLVAWDYDPATQGEMQLLAQPILQHLQRKGVSTVFMSLQPFGPNVATDAHTLSARMLPPHMASAAPNPVEFGFIPGDNAALRSLALSPIIASNQPAMSSLATGMHPAQTIDAFDLIIELSANMASTQKWVEQIAVRSKKPLIVAASGAVAPALRPYEQSGQIRVLLSGYPDALAYETLLGQKGPAYAQASAQTLALLAFLVVLFVAAFRSLLHPPSTD